MDFYGFVFEGVGKFEVGGGEEEAVDSEIGPGELVGFVAAVAHVADDGVADVGDVAADLMASPGVGRELD